MKLLRRSRDLAVVIVASLWVGFSAWSQTITIPDFRQLSPEPATLKPGEPCHACGRILSIREVQVPRQTNVSQPFQSGGTVPSSGPGGRYLVGAVVYMPLGNDSSERPFVGGVGTPEMRERFQQTTYEIGLRMDDGSTRFVKRADGAAYRVGDRIRISELGQLELVVDR